MADCPSAPSAGHDDRTREARHAGRRGRFVVRAMTNKDVDHVLRVGHAAAADLRRRLGAAPPPGPADQGALDGRRQLVRYLLARDPAGAAVAEVDGEVVGEAMALRRPGVWWLTSLFVHPQHQSVGVGTALLRRVLAYADGVRAALTHSSGDARALRAYARAGFGLHPMLRAEGPLRDRSAPPLTSVREGDLGDVEATERIDRHVRGRVWSDELRACLAAGGRLYLVGGEGYVVVRRGDIWTLSATSVAVARTALWAGLVHGHGQRVVPFLRVGQQWAVDVVLDAGLSLQVSGALCVRGSPRLTSSLLLSGAYC